MCVLQTAISLKETGHRSHVVSDAVSSRRMVDKETALERLRCNAIGLVPTEMVIFDWLARGDDEAFGLARPTAVRHLLPCR